MDNKEDNLDIGKLSNLEIALIKKLRSISKNDKDRVIEALENNILNKQDSPNSNEFTFDNFVVGDSNRSAYTAAKDIADLIDLRLLEPLVGSDTANFNPNPLLIYGEKEAGKTHLLNAIRNELKNNKPSHQIAFVDENNPISQVSTNADVLLVDDVHLYMNDEFFNIYNSFIANRKQVVLTADKQYPQFKYGEFVNIKPLTTNCR